ncbi:hypothetical protein Scep_029805 [Stephania cephalantha]|uniref:Uncharacterized protein n=1 Tax=Stephania cephalantha TaxID=152367 RepID=A0AAP0E626_9MAGN
MEESSVGCANRVANDVLRFAISREFRHFFFCTCITKDEQPSTPQRYARLVTPYESCRIKSIMD